MTIPETIKLKLLPVGTRSGFVVVCADCGRDLGQVQTEREAYCRAGEFIHDCRGKKPVYNPCPKCGTGMLFGDHELQYCPNPRCDQ